MYIAQIRVENDREKKKKPKQKKKRSLCLYLFSLTFEFILRWLYVKHWLTVQRHHKVDLASKRQWRRFWTCLKGSSLYFYHADIDLNAKLILGELHDICQCQSFIYLFDVIS
jgi:hypothetical protein